MRELLVLCAAAACTHLACTKECTAIACIPTLVIQLSHRVGGPGAYEVVIEHDGRVERCSYESDGNTPRAGSGVTCGELHLSFDEAAALSFIQGPNIERPTLTIRRDGAVLVSETLSPDYEAQELNGPGCGTCPFASEELDTSAVSAAG